MPEELVKKIDAAAKKRYSSRSELFRELAYNYTQRIQEWKEIRQIGRIHAKELKKMGIRNYDDVTRIVNESRHDNQ